jgi:hypothetical protein
MITKDSRQYDQESFVIMECGAARRPGTGRGCQPGPPRGATAMAFASLAT